MAKGPLEALAEIERKAWAWNFGDGPEFCRWCQTNKGREHEERCPIAALRRHLEPQPIKSAPRDGQILAFDDGWHVAWFASDAWWDEGDNCIEPTHWLPLPAPANQERRS